MSRIALIPVILFATAATLRAETLPYQGLLTDSKGFPVKDSTYALNLSLYGQSQAGTPVWSEAQTISTKKGLFSLNLGTVNAITGSTLQRDSLFLGLTVSGSKAEMSPRARLGRTPWTMHSLKADTATFARSAGGISELNTSLANTRDSLKQTRDSVSALKDRVSKIESDLASVLALLKGIKRSGSELYFDSMNVNIRNGLGNTRTYNALGNLVVGYNEMRTSDNLRTGSHSVIMGTEQNWSSYGNFVSGFRNAATGPFATVAGGKMNVASGTLSSISGGTGNTASGDQSSILGGNSNKAVGHTSSIVGGWDNTTNGGHSSVLGGNGNKANGASSTIGGGLGITTSDNYQVLP